jgi:hypothetical protein
MVSIEIIITVAGIMLSNVLLLLNKIKVFKGCCCEFETKEDDRLRTAKHWKDKLFSKGNPEHKNKLDRQTSTALSLSNGSTSPKQEPRQQFRSSSDRRSPLERIFKKSRQKSPRKNNKKSHDSNESTIRKKVKKMSQNTVVTNISCADDIIAVKTEHLVTVENITTDWTFCIGTNFNEKDFEEQNENSPTNERDNEGTSIRTLRIRTSQSRSMGDINKNKNVILYMDMLNKVQRMGSSSEEELSNFPIMGSSSEDEQSNFQNGVCIDGVCIDGIDEEPTIHITEIHKQK